MKFHLSTGKRACSVDPAWDTLCGRAVLSDETVASRPGLPSDDRLTDDPEKVNCRTCNRRHRGGKMHSMNPKETR